jgi:response regulator RpfG family c-di-GMP phosphodiesterase
MNDSLSPGVPAKAVPFTVLCVDDETNILNALMRLLRPHGYRVLTAESGAEGLAMMVDTPVDLVLSDMRMPEMDGAVFLEQVKACSPDTVRILLTGYADLSSTIAAVNNGGIYRYIAKPWDDAGLIGVVGDALERKLLEREKLRLEELTHAQNEALKALNASLEAKVQARTADLAEALGSLEKAHERLKKSFFTSIKVFTNLIELREGVMAGHSRHVAESARRIAKHMKLGEAEVQDIVLAGLLHGIGEFGLTDAQLRKSLSDLTFEERAAVVKHPLKAQAALMALDDLAGAGKLIRSYRERYDGAGYPDAIRGLAIPEGARVLCVAHDYEAAQEGTLIGRPLSKLQARDYIDAARGKRYDPVVVDAFTAILDDLGVRRRGARAVFCAELREGMALERDLVAPDGLLLLSKGSVLNAVVIEQIRKYDARDGGQMKVHVSAS